MHIFALGFPAFNVDDQLHLRIAGAAEVAEKVASGIELDDAWQFQRARRVAREALADHGVAGEINEAVAELLRATAPPEAAAALATVAS